MQKMVAHFDALVDQGLKVIPLRQFSKIPICKGWTKWDKDQCRAILYRQPECNIGVLLGEIIDVEGDSEQANQLILDMIGGCPHPTYTSSKSIHHLFQTPDPKLTILKFQDIEFRGIRHQSVLPPSQMSDGTIYKWLKSFRFPVPEMPERLLKFYRNLKSKKKIVIKPGHMKLYCSICEQKCFIHQRRFESELAIFKEMGRKWECQECRDIDLRPLVRELRKQTQQRLIAQGE